MSIAAGLIPEFEHEMTSTRRVLEALPETLTAWKPHAKSMEFHRLATLVAEMPGWFPSVPQQPDFQITEDYVPPAFTDRGEILQLFERNVRAARAALEGTPDERWGESWSLVWLGQTVLSLPRPAAYRMMTMNHFVHHRAQVMMYMRMNDLVVPGVYGQSADEHETGG